MNSTLLLSDIKNQLLNKPALVQEQDVLLLKNIFYKIQQKPKDFFILQIGDCAESFEDCTKEIVFQKCEFYTEIAKLLELHLQKEVVLLGRIAGQYAKPRTEEFEQKNGCILPSYRGDMINDHAFDPIARMPNYSRILQAYMRSADTVKFMNEFYKLHPNKKIFTSHEALMLDYESALTRTCVSQNTNEFFSGSAHTVWLGDRSRHLNADHIDYLSTIINPIGIKIGPTQSPETLIDLLKKLNPEKIPGKLYLITRLGAETVKTQLPKLIDVVLKENFPVIWCMDPMHGNTFKLENGRKVRAVNRILEESLFTAEVHHQSGTVLSGIHLEATFLPVTECVVKKEDAEMYDFNSYTTKCDPRLNPAQVQMLLNQMNLF